MQILNTKYSVNTSNWTKRTPPYLKFFCDFLLFLSLVVGVLPEIPTPIGKWILFGGVVAKLLSNFISDHLPATAQPTNPEVTP
jgi:hypothetical protein